MTGFAAAFALLLGGAALGLLLSRTPRAALAVGAVSCAAAGVAGLVPTLAVLRGGAELAARLPWGVPGGELSLGVDPLSAAFLVPIFGLSPLFAVYGAGYLAAYAGRKRLGVPVCFFNLLVAAMALVVMARNAVLFLVAWETMSVASFFLVAFEDERAEVREASRRYLIAMHLGSAFLLAFFALLARETGTTELAAGHAWAPGMATALFALAAVGFGTKAGLWPLHVWLPRAHPAAPSHVSALMSGVMIKTGVYGLCRALVLLGPPQASWGFALMALGVGSALLGISSALAQRDLKALLACSSGENVGIVVLGLGIGVVGASAGRPAVAAAGFAGALFHVWNHGLFKGLLFLGAGNVAHGAGTRDLERLGGLLKRLPRTGALFLAGSAAICALPPLNGLGSEWLVYSALFRAGASLPGPGGLAALLAAAGLALVGGLALAAFTRAAGVVFLGEPRSQAAAGAHEVGPALLAPMGVLAALCLAAGLAPPLFVGLLAPAAGMLAPGAVGELGRLALWSGPLGWVGACSAGTALLAGAALGVRRWVLAGRPVGASPTWDCGYAAPAVRMQYTGGSFAEPLTALLAPVLRPQVRLAAPEGFFPAGGRLEVHAPDLAERRVWEPLFRGVGGALLRLRVLQQGRVQRYLLYLLATLVGLLAWALGS
ncbi:MAG: proton-conducting transporter transmembrane domain-containing protein [Deferrisomatales bacterium]